MLQSNRDMTHCRACGKIIHAAPGRRLCHACAGDLDDTNRAPAPEVEALRHRAKQEELILAVHRRQQAERGESPEQLATSLCIRCHKKPPMEASQFCLPCQVALHAEVREAAQEAEDKLQKTQRHQVKSHRIDRALEEKRDRTASSRIQVSPPAWKY